MKKILIASCLVLALSGCKKPATPAASADQSAATAQSAGQPAADPAAEFIQARCDQLREEYFPAQLDRLRVTVEFKGRMLEVRKAGGAEEHSALAKLREEMEARLAQALAAHGMKSEDDLNAKDCPPSTTRPVLDPKATAEFQELAKKLAAIEGELNTFIVQPAHTPDSLLAEPPPVPPPAPAAAPSAPAAGGTAPEAP